MIPGIRITAGLGTREIVEEAPSGSWLLAAEVVVATDAMKTVNMQI
jgi:hypothetical protein